MTEAQTFAATLDSVRNYTRWYFSKLKGVDLHREFMVEGKRLNTAYWLFAHITSSQNWLILRGIGGDMVRLPWAKLFNVGQTPPGADQLPPIEEILAAAKDIHSKVLEHVRGLSEEQLSAPHKAMMDLGGDGSRREVIMHCIRHESLHTGQLATLCKLYDVKTI